MYDVYSFDSNTVIGRLLDRVTGLLSRKPTTVEKVTVPEVFSREFPMARFIVAVDSFVLERTRQIEELQALRRELQVALDERRHADDLQVGQMERELNLLMKENPFSTFRGDEKAYEMWCWAQVNTPVTANSDDLFGRAFRSAFNLHRMKMAAKK